MIRQNRSGDRDDRDGGRSAGREEAEAPALDEAGGIDRDQLNPRRSGAAPVEQNDRTRDRELEEPSAP